MIQSKHRKAKSAPESRPSLADGSKPPICSASGLLLYHASGSIGSMWCIHVVSTPYYEYRITARLSVDESEHKAIGTKLHETKLYRRPCDVYLYLFVHQPHATVQLPRAHRRPLGTIRYASDYSSVAQPTAILVLNGSQDTEAGLSVTGLYRCCDGPIRTTASSLPMILQRDNAVVKCYVFLLSIYQVR